ncbi:MAG: hypothetical protein PF444_08320 [Bacteroidales bacterium]|jgi:hypothetical protein|nr:hypothetical protein [Bacteroidales bacterium]
MNYSIFFIAIAFSLVETDYFGWNFMPRSDAEIICDGIVMIMLAMAFLVRNNKENGE